MAKRICSVVLALVMALSLVPAARAADIVDSGQCGDDLTWTLDRDGLLTISGTGMMTSSPWSEYWKGAIKKVVIEPGAESICSTAFSDCIALAGITIPDSVTYIGWNAFQNCASLADIAIPDSVTYIDSHTFSDCTSLVSVTIPDSVTDIGRSAFSGCTSLAAVTIPNSVTSIGQRAFSGCTSLTDVTMISSTVKIGEGAFASCTSLAGFTVSSENKIFSTEDGVLFNKAKSILICYPGGKKGAYAIPGSVMVVADSAFNGCEALSSITIPDGVVSIGKNTFYRCSSLAYAVLPASVTSIGDEAFYDCNNLADVYYGGTEEQWKAVKIGQWNHSLTNATIRCNSDGPSEKPDAPTNVTAAADASHYSVSVRWERPAGAVKYAVYRREYDSTAKKWGKWIIVSRPAGTWYTDYDVTSGNTYAYKIRANNGSKWGAYSVVAKVKMPFPKPPAPVNAAAKAFKGKITVTWDEPNGYNVTRYAIYRNVYDASAKKWAGWELVTSKLKTASYTDKTVEKGVRYAYRVRAYNGAWSAKSATVKATAK